MMSDGDDDLQFATIMKLCSKQVMKCKIMVASRLPLSAFPLLVSICGASDVIF